jgi:hypothetical protein
VYCAGILIPASQGHKKSEPGSSLSYMVFP